MIYYKKLQIKDDLKAISCRSTWRVEQSDLEMAKNQIASKRLRLDDILSKLYGVQFFISCITAVCSNPKESNADQDANVEDRPIFPAVSYFIVFRQTETCNQNKIYQLLHNENMNAVIQGITSRVEKANDKKMEKYARQLFQVVKDHNNQFVTDMLNESNAYCLANCQESTSADENEGPSNTDQRRPPQQTHPCRVIVVNVSEFESRLHDIVRRLQSDGLAVDITSMLVAQIDGPCLAATTDEVPETIRRVWKVMQICNHALHRGDVYAKPNEATMAYIKMMDVATYLNKLLTNEAIRGKVLKHFSSLLRILSHPACSIVPQIEFDLDLIEVSNGFFFHIPTRVFIRNAIPAEKCGKTSPRAFVPYNCETPPEPGYFREGILNSFPDPVVRANFCNKFYQCFLAFKMPHKIRKLVVAGPKDSGKTSWASIFHRIITPGKIASITPERQFSASMIDDETQLVFVDEWSESTLESDLAKTILQGGWMVTAMKHRLPRVVMNNSPFYITANKVPHFGDDNENVKRRIEVFETTSLPHCTPGVDRWMYDHAMDCVSWLANEITTNREHVNPDELWYEPTRNVDLQTININEGFKLFDPVVLSNITNDDLSQASTVNVEDVSSTQIIHESFEVQRRRERLLRKRIHRSILDSSTSSDENELSPQTTPSDNSHIARSNSEAEVCNASSQRSQSNDERSKQISVHPHQPLTSADSHRSQIPDNNHSDVNNKRASQNSFSGGLQCKRRRARCGRMRAPVATNNIHNEGNLPHEAGDSTRSKEPSQIFVGQQSQWTLNDVLYHRRIVELWQNEFGRSKLSRAHAASFISRRTNAERKRNREEKEFWTKADPEIDAWMIVTGRKREVFDIDLFVKRHENSIRVLKEVRAKVQVRVMADRCPVLQAVERKTNAQ